MIRVTAYNAIDPENRTLSFTLPDRLGIERTLTFNAAMVLRLFRCETPSRSEWRGSNDEYSRLLSVARHFGWVLPDKPGYMWSYPLATRERRLTALQCWMTR